MGMPGDDCQVLRCPPKHLILCPEDGSLRMLHAHIDVLGWGLRRVLGSNDMRYINCCNIREGMMCWHEEIFRITSSELITFQSIVKNKTKHKLAVYVSPLANISVQYVYVDKHREMLYSIKC